MSAVNDFVAELTARGWTQMQIKEATGISQAMISDLLNGKREDINYTQGKKLERLLAAAIPAIYRAIAFFGGDKKLGDAVGSSAAVVYQWKSGIRPISPEKCVAIEQKTGGAVSRCDLYFESAKKDPASIWPELCAVPREPTFCEDQ